MAVGPQSNDFSMTVARALAGFIPIHLGTAREHIGANNYDLGNTAQNGGILDNQTTPTYEARNTTNDACQIITWIAGNVDPIAFSVPLPPDLDDVYDVVIHFRAAMGVATNTPTIASASFFNEGDTAVSDASAAVTGVAFAEYTIAIDDADVPAGAQTLTFQLTPGAHAADTVILSAIWIEYTRTGVAGSL